MTRRFTIEEADAMIGTCAHELRLAAQMLAQAHTIGRGLSEALSIQMLTPGVSVVRELGLDRVAHDPALRAALVQGRMLLGAADDIEAGLHARGVVVRSLARGLIDFRSVVDGEREIWLCWQLGERRVTHFHELHEGFVDRRPVADHRFFRTRQLVPPHPGDEAPPDRVT